MPFSNPVAGGNTLVRTQLQSEGFVSGSTGWAIRRNGTSEFTGVQINGGTLIVQGATGGMFLYSGTPATGNLVASIAAAAGTDPYGNAYPKGEAVFGTDGSQLFMTAGATNTAVSFTPPTVVGHTWTPGSISTLTDGAVPPHSLLYITSPADNATPIGQDALSFIQLWSATSTGGGTELDLAASRINLNSTGTPGGPITLAGGTGITIGSSTGGVTINPTAGGVTINPTAGTIQITSGTGGNLNLYASNGTLTLNSSGQLNLEPTSPSVVSSVATYNNTSTFTANVGISTTPLGHLYRITSSRRYKVDIQPAVIPLAALLDLRPITYYDKGQADEQDGSTQGLSQQLGLIAEDVADVGGQLADLLVELDTEGRPESVNYDRLGVALLSAVQQLLRQVDQLAQRVSALESR